MEKGIFLSLFFPVKSYLVTDKPALWEKKQIFPAAGQPHLQNRQTCQAVKQIPGGTSLKKAPWLSWPAASYRNSAPKAMPTYSGRTK
jgi:hypothetical protein